MLRLLIFTLLFVFCSKGYTAGPIFNTNTVTLQQGDGFKVGEPKRQILTLEHYSLWTKGDVYFFYDNIRSDKNGQHEYYGEFSPRLSLSVFGIDTKVGWIKDILIAGTYENGSNDFKAYLIGPGLSLNIPGFTYFSANMYYRNTHNVAGETWQFTASWGLPFNIASSKWLFDGYTDIRGSEGNLSSDTVFNPQLKLDIGHWFDWDNHLYAGVEYYYWQNKFGIKGVDENFFSPLLQAQFSF